MHLKENVLLLQAILLAEFDIDAGASFRSIYPDTYLDSAVLSSSFDGDARATSSSSPSSSFQDSLANLMLPDGAEKWEVSSTIFLLNRGESPSSCLRLHRYPVYGLVEQSGAPNLEWIPLRAPGVKLPELLVLNGNDSKISLVYHGKTLAGPWLASELQVEFPEEIPISVSHFISSLQEGLRYKEGSSGTGNGSTGVEKSKEGEGTTSNESREVDSFAFVKLGGDTSKLGIVMTSVDFKRFLQSYRELQENLLTVSSVPDGISHPTSTSDLTHRRGGNNEEIDHPSRKSIQVKGRAPLFAVTAVVSQKDSTARRGGITKAVAAVGSSLVWLQSVFPLLVHCAYCCCSAKGTKSEIDSMQRSFLQECFETLRPLALSMSEQYAKAILPALSLKKQVQVYSTSTVASSVYQECLSHCVTALSATFSLVVPLSPHSDNIVLPDYHFERLLLTFGVDFIVLILGILTGKKIIVLSREHSAFEVCQVVIALGIIGSILHPDFFQSKVFPYVSINETNFSEVPGYVIGSMNPIFENSKVWGWDLLCDLDSETVRNNGGSEDMLLTSPTTSFSLGSNKKYNSSTAVTMASNTMANIASAVGITNTIGGGGHASDSVQEKNALPSHAARLHSQLLASVAHMQALRLPLSERCLRIKLQIEEYCHVLVLLGYCEGFPEYPIPMKVLSPYFFSFSGRHIITQSHLAGMTCNIKTAVLLSEQEPPHLMLWCAALRRCGGYSMKDDPYEVQHILEVLLDMLKTEESILLFLRRMPVALGGLNSVAMQLTHPQLAVRKSAMLLLRRLESSPSGKVSLSSLNHFLMLLYDRFSKADIK